MTQRLRFGIALVFALSLLVCATGASRSAGDFGISGGTWIIASGQVLGPAFVLDGPSSSFGATLAGPGGFSRHIGGPNQRFPGMPSTLSVNWCQPSECSMPATGSWSAKGDDGSQAAFSIDTASHLTPIVLTRDSFLSSTTGVTATWTAGTDAQSFAVYLQPASSTSATTWTAGMILSSGARGVTFSGLALDPKTSYSLDVFAFSDDIAGETIPSVFNIASDRIDFTPGQPLAGSTPLVGSVFAIGKGQRSCLPISTTGTTVVPNVVGEPLDTAILTLLGRRLLVSVAHFDPFTDLQNYDEGNLEDYKIRSQSPAPGTKLSAGTKVSLTTGYTPYVGPLASRAVPKSHPRYVTVPNLVGKAYYDAVAESRQGLFRAGYSVEIGKIGPLTPEASRCGLDGFVVSSQAPRAGTRVSWGGINDRRDGSAVVVISLVSKP